MPRVFCVLAFPQGLAESIEQLGTQERVYNLEIHGEHVFRVASSGLLVHNSSGAQGSNGTVSGFEPHGFNPPPGTRQIPQGIPKGWRIRSTQGEGGVWYYDPTSKGNAVRVMPGDSASPFPNSQSPYVRWQRNGQPLDVNGNVLPTKKSPDAHIPLRDFRFDPGVF